MNGHDLQRIIDRKMHLKFKWMQEKRYGKSVYKTCKYDITNRTLLSDFTYFISIHIVRILLYTFIYKFIINNIITDLYIAV